MRQQLVLVREQEGEGKAFWTSQVYAIGFEGKSQLLESWGSITAWSREKTCTRLASA